MLKERTKHHGKGGSPCALSGGNLVLSREDLPTACEPTKQIMEGSNTPNKWPCMSL